MPQNVIVRIKKCRDTYDPPLLHPSNTITINVSINNFGEESLRHITATFAKEINHGIAKLIDTIHFNPDVPENHNIRLENVKGQLVAVFQNNSWVIQDMNDTVNHMIDKGSRMLTNHYHTSSNLQKEDMDMNHGIIYRRLNSVTCRE